MTTPVIRKKNQEYQKNINKRGLQRVILRNANAKKDEPNKFPISAFWIYLFLFVVVGGGTLGFLT